MTPPSTPLKAVVFDMDGLLVNTEILYQQVGTEILRRRGKLFDKELLDQMMGRPPSVSLQLMIDYHSLADTVAGLAAESQQIFSGILPQQLALMPGADAFLTALEQAGIPRAVATSSGPRFVDEVFSLLGLAPRFDFVLTCDDIVHGKPAPDIYLLAAKRFQLSPGELMVLEDSGNGCRAAIAAETFAVAVPGGHSHSHSFEGAQFIATSLADPRIYAALGLQ